MEHIFAPTGMVLPWKVLSQFRTDRWRVSDTNTVRDIILTVGELVFFPASTVIGAIGGASPKPGNGEGCVRKGIRRKILISTLLF
jgi:hypothetical protein